MPLVSIIIVNWNGKKWLGKCLSSLTGQDFNRFEIVVVDNKSSDGSVSYIKDHFKNVRIIQNDKNFGFARANNIGIKQSKGEYILLINSDTWVEKDFLVKIFNSYKNHKCDVLGPTETQYKSPKFTKYKYTIDVLGYPVMQTGKNGRLFYIKGSCLFFQKQLYIDSKGFDNDFFMYFEECDWFWRLQLLGKKIYQDENLFIYHDGIGMQKHKNPYPYFLWRNQNTLQMLLKNYSLISLILVLPIYLIQNTAEFIVFILFLKPKIAFTYIEGWIFNIRKLSRTLKKREWIQRHRVVSDIEIIKLMYAGSGKLKHLIG
jgi:GT2 family glycosyltransferase